MYFDPLHGPTAFDTVPKPASKEIEAALGRLFNATEGEGFFEHHAKAGTEPFSSANYLFFMDSQWVQGNKEIAMLSLIVDEGLKPAIFQTTLEKFATAIKANKDGYKMFYAKSGKDDKGSEKALKLEKFLLADCFEACRRKPEAQKPGRMIILGLQAVGKTSIINQVTSAKFNPKITPTLGMQMLNKLVDDFKFTIYDLGGQEKIRATWYDKKVNPEAVIFVIDATADKAHQDESKREFDRMVENFFSKDSPNKLPANTPVLILANKVDLNPDLKESGVEKLLQPGKKQINYRIGLCSAMKNEGLEES
nr:ADP-ribosylation factor-like protein [Candidatus Sigynarchaeota archaeon]